MERPAVDLNALRARITELKLADERAVVADLIEAASDGLESGRRAAALAQSRMLTSRCRDHAEESGTLDAFLKQFGLSNPEGVALMCLAEALLRVPDDDTADRLIAEKINSGDWAAHLGESDSLFVNGSVWGLMLTGRLVTVEPEAEGDPGSWVRQLVSRVGEPIVRSAVVQAMRILGRQYVLGRTIEEALARAAGPNDVGDLYSFDMLGEGARTWEDARRYEAAYRDAIEAIGATPAGTDPRTNHGISIKLSALHPRFEASQRDTMLDTLTDSLTSLARLARSYELGFSIDAEEADRLELTLDLFERLARAPELAGWNGLGFVLQAYQKRAPQIADWLIALARETDRAFMVRLVKGAYWDAEIKHAQELGLPDYPVYTRKPNSDLCYEVCAARLLAAPDVIYPQFATHNATTACQALELGGDQDFELQRLHGMGELMFAELDRETGQRRVPLRVYAPVGSHQDLLPYLVRRLLENGANSSFVNRFLDEQVPVDELVQDPLLEVREAADARHSRIPKPLDLYRAAGEPRQNSAGLDLTVPALRQSLRARFATLARESFSAAAASGSAETAVRSPANVEHIVGRVREASPNAVRAAIERAKAAEPLWSACPVEERAACLEAAADALESDRDTLLYLLGAEAGRTVPDALAEIREAADFLRYYAWQARQHFAERTLPGPTGEANALGIHPRGTFACISPWNFPLAIFLGQLSAALAAGNCVLAKPAEQTPLVAARAVHWLQEAGVPENALQLLPGDGATIGALLTADDRINGFAFTGSTATARQINQALAARTGPIVPFIAETGGQNVMIADSTALPEQLVDDVITSAFRSAGQRCSALRVLYLPSAIADKVLDMLRGAMAALTLGDPLDLATDIGPVIDAAARDRLLAHSERMDREATPIAALETPSSKGSFFAPRAYEIDSISSLEGEVFGPILHVVRYRPQDLDRVINEINGTGYGLTLGIHSRIAAFAEEIHRRVRAGNTYVNRNMIGAVVGVQPFGGQGLSGTGPKAGGPHYLERFTVERTFTDNITARGGNAALFELDED